MATVPDQDDVSLTAGRAAVMVLLAGVAGGAAVWLLAPEYFARGFPLDDAWIHAVYGRSLARSGMLAYNPGVPATGATSPLWALVLALPHIVTSQVPAVLVGIKLLGFTLHVVASLLLLGAFVWRGRVGLPALVGSMLAAFHPDLVGASMSGMEVPLATMAGSALLLAAVRSGTLVYGLLSFVAPLARPELGVFCLAVPVGLFVRRDRHRLLMLTGAACLGNVVAYGVVGARNLAVSGRPLPATFYAKAGVGDVGLVNAQVAGFSELLARLPVVDSLILLTIAMLLAVWVMADSHAPPPTLQLAAGAFLAGLLFCAASFALVPPIDPMAFYHQRYILPALPSMVAAMPVLLSYGLGRLVPGRAFRLGRIALFALLVLSVLVVARFRFTALANDAHNIDDVQVGIGRYLAAAPAHEVIWAVDAGAVRYFGGAFVVDLLGLNNAELLGPRAQDFLDAHAPRYIEAVPAWSAVDAASGRRLTTTEFRTSTAYTATSYKVMQQHWLVLCHDPDVAGDVALRGRTFLFRCAGR